MVFQNYALFPHMTVFGNIAFGLEAKHIPSDDIRKKVESVLDAVRLRDKADAPVPLLSGGEQQRVAVARALVLEPALLLFDEPLSNLDVTLRLQTREEIRSLRRKTGITTVYHGRPGGSHEPLGPGCGYAGQEVRAGGRSGRRV
jgi:ABC-type sugar transport system ATPase subunit